MALLAPIANATVFEYEDLNANNGGGLSDKLQTIKTTFDDNTDVFTWDVTFNNASTGVDGFWLVVNNGSNPKSSDVNELAIIYGDLSTGIASTYVYNGQNSANSIVNGTLLQTDTMNVSANGFSLTIDATDNINGYSGWDTPTAGDINGIGFDNKLGAWFHISKDSNFGYSQDGDITSYSYGKQGHWDKANLTATEVPEPGTIALLTLGLAGLGLARKKQ